MAKYQTLSRAAFGALMALLMLPGPGELRAQLPSRPETAPTPVRLPAHEAGLRLQDLIQLSLERNPVLSQATFDIEAARGRAVQAGLYPNPTVSMVGDELGGRQGPGGRITAPLVSQEIVTGGKLRLSRAVAERGIDQASLTLLRQRFALFTTVRQGYFEVLADQRRIEVLNELVQLASQSSENARKILGAGEGSKPDVLQFQIELARLQTERETAGRDLIAAWRRLVASLGAPELPYRSLIGSLDDPIPDYDFDRSRTIVLEESPEVRSARVGITRAQLALQRAQAEPIPNVTLGSGYTRNNKDRDNEWTIQASVPIPVFNRNQGNIREAQAELGRATRDVDRVQTDLVGRLATAFGQYASARQRAERYRREILPAAQESYRLTLLAFRGGQFEYLRVLQAQRTIAEANLSLIQALSEQWRAASEIAGLLLEEEWPVPTCRSAFGSPGPGQTPTK